ncbi:26S proteasome regulatory subunit N6 [Nematocida sp. AWRm80]|nr:26S proteasome regulatory subunit N6 [Nematocida sp. AWRm80]
MGFHPIEERISGVDKAEVVRNEIISAIHNKNIEEIESILDSIANTQKISKASSAILLKNALDTVEKELPDKEESIRMYNKMIAWAESNKRNLLKLDFKMRKAEALLGLERYKECLEVISETAKTLKQADDKLSLVKLYCLESRVFYELKNLPKAKSSLTLSKSTSTFVYCPPLLQAKMDLLSGIYSADEREYKTASSYLLEALDGFSVGQNTQMVIKCARYLVLMKILSNKTNEMKALLTNKLIAPYTSDHCIQILSMISEYVADRNLRKCNDIIQQNLSMISEDKFLTSHLVYLCDNLIDSNILKIIEPYSTIKVEYIGARLNLDVPTIENRIRRMILDGKINGTLDQETMSISIYCTPKKANESLKETADIIDVLSDITNNIAPVKQ